MGETYLHESEPKERTMTVLKVIDGLGLTEFRQHISGHIRKSIEHQQPDWEL
jgi:hypothetical protein